MKLVDLTASEIDSAIYLIKEDLRLQRLTNEELIRECLKDDLTDDPRVIELMNRVMPDWLEGGDYGREAEM